MNTEQVETADYEKYLKKGKIFTIMGEVLILLLRILAQRLFSAYLGIVIIQIMISTMIYFKKQCHTQARFYILMNVILVYLLTINFVQVLNNQDQSIQNVLKDKYIVDYIKIGYPLQFAYRFVSTVVVWRLYQFSRMKSNENQTDLFADETQLNTSRIDRVHVRQNTNQPNFQWNLNIFRNQTENQRNLQNSDTISQNISLSNSRMSPQRLNQISNQDSRVQNVQSRIVPGNHRHFEINNNQNGQYRMVPLSNNIRPYAERNLPAQNVVRQFVSYPGNQRNFYPFRVERVNFPAYQQFNHQNLG